MPHPWQRPRTNAEYWDEKLRRNIERDRETDRLAEEAGWRVIRVWEHQDPDEVVPLIRSAVRA